ncbi:hypothetical protein HMN09_00952900 [Mycena chlorophos]|uniref:Tyr recombinase domain-containing protein n=1 Tax=Mycena chlorophos TaxID=658473 RepID=A0A8H6W068_MYCCL|nr:hypothetical protein HMN09_00952900 [Mycena chlorophos]
MSSPSNGTPPSLDEIDAAQFREELEDSDEFLNAERFQNVLQSSVDGFSEDLIHADKKQLYNAARVYVQATLTATSGVSAGTSAASRFAAEMAQSNISQGTRDGYVAIIAHFISFHQGINAAWDPTSISENTPSDITAFISQKCGPKEQNFEGRKASVSTRAALTLWYSYVQGRELSMAWYFNQQTQKWCGLPTRSKHVSDFMVGLEKTKAKSGEASTSARIVRYAAYLLAWLLMLRVDEVVNLRIENIEKHPNDDEAFLVKMLVRKNAPEGVRHSWKLWANDDDEKICPVRIMILLCTIYDTQNIGAWTGPLFRRVNSAGAVLHDKPVTASILGRSLSKDLQSLGYTSWALYGTHSFRRGGCQYRFKEKRWALAQIAAWGGWSQVEAATMFRYLYSPNDNHEYLHEYDKNH